MGCCASGGNTDDDGAKKTKQKGKEIAKKTLHSLEWKEFKKVEIDDVDAWFDSVAEVINTIKELGEACDTANEGVLKLCEAKELIDDGVKEKTVGAVVRYMVKTVKVKGGSVKVEIDGDGKLTLKVEGEGCGAGWDVFDGVMKLVEALNKFVHEMITMEPKVEEFVKKTEEITEKIEAGAQGAPNPIKAATIAKNGAHDVKVLAAIPKVIVEAIKSVKELLTTLKEICEGKDAEGKGEAAEGEEKEED